MKTKMNNRDSTANKIDSESRLGGLHYRLSKGSDNYAKTVKSLAEYAGQEFGHQMRVLLSQGKEAMQILPKLPEKATRAEELKWGKDYDMALRNNERFEKNKGQVFPIILGLCQETVKNKVESLSAYAKMEEDMDGVRLLGEIKAIAFESSEKQYPAKTAMISVRELSNMHQWEGESLIEYYNRFNDAVERLDRTFGEFYPKVLVDADTRAKVKPEQNIEDAKEIYMTVVFMETCNRPP
jgi:hypothetical protein